MAPDRAALFGSVGLACVALLVSMVLFAPIGIWFPAMWAATGVAILVACAARVADRDTRDALVLTVLAGVCARMLAALFMFDHPLRLPDALYYWRLGTRLADLWTGPQLSDVSEVRVLYTNRTGYFAWVAGHSLILRREILVTLSNALVGGANIIMTYLIGRHVWNARIGRNAAILIASSTAMIYISGSNMRDVLATLSGLAIVYGAVQLADRWSVKGVVWFALGLVALLQIRQYIAGVVVLVLLVTMVAVRREGRLKILFLMVTVGTGVVFAIASHEVVIIVSKLVRGHGVFEMLKFAQRGLIGTRPRASLISGMYWTSWSDLAVFLPVGFIRAWLGPQPWMATKMDVFLIPDVIVRYFAFPLFLVGLWHSIRTDWRRLLLVALVLFGEMAIYAMIELGGNTRHHTQYFPYHYIFVAIGWTVAHRYGQAIWIGYALISVSVIGFGMSPPFSKWYMPLTMLLFGLLWVASVRPWRAIATPAST